MQIFRKFFLMIFPLSEIDDLGMHLRAQLSQHVHVPDQLNTILINAHHGDDTNSWVKKTEFEIIHDVLPLF